MAGDAEAAALVGGGDERNGSWATTLSSLGHLKDIRSIFRLGAAGAGLSEPDQDAAARQKLNLQWWTKNPMTYDWGRTSTATELSAEWFQEMDHRFISASFPYLSGTRPFDKIMPDQLDGARVLEVGCGMGLHTAALVSRGARVTAIDITPVAVEATKRRLELANLTGQVLQCDAEVLPFEENTFDFVWSWGVIHHSSKTAKVVREISRVLVRSGEARVMVYNRDGASARALLLRRYLLSGRFLKESADDVLWRHTDGYLARYYHLDQFNDLFSAFFQSVSTVVLGQEVDVLPLPKSLRRVAAGVVPRRAKVRAASSRGGFLFTTAHNPT